MATRAEALCGTPQTRRRRCAGRADRRECLWPLAPEQQPRAVHRHVKRLLQPTRSAVPRPPTDRLIRRTAVVRDPYARWCGRGGAVRRPPIPITKTAQLHNPLGRHPEGQDLSTDRPGRRSGQRSTSVEITQQPRNPRETLARHGENEAGAFRAAGTRARGRLSPPRREPANDPFEDGGDQNGDRCNSDPASGRLHVRRSWGEADGRPEGLTASPGQAHGGACRQTGGA